YSADQRSHRTHDGGTLQHRVDREIPRRPRHGATVRSRGRRDRGDVGGRVTLPRGRLDGRRDRLQAVRRHVRAPRLRPEEDPGRRILLAAGAKPAPLPFAGAERLTTSEEFLNLDRLPSRLVFVGGGYISFEFAHVAARAGAEVTIVHRASRPLEAFDPDMVDL